MKLVEVTLHETGHLGKFLDAAAALPSDELHRPASEGHWSLFETLRHMVSVEDGWMSRLAGEKPLKEKGWYEELDDADALKEHWKSVAARTRAFLESLDEESLKRRLKSGGETTTVEESLTWYVVHYWHHNGEAVQLFKLYTPKDVPRWVEV